MTAPYDFTVDLVCEDDQVHRLGVRDGKIVVLDHNEKTVKAFSAFDAPVPPCVEIAEQLRPVVATYYATLAAWRRTLWANFYRDPDGEIDTSDMTIDDLQARMATAVDHRKVARTRKQIAEQKAILNAADPRMFLDASAMQRYAKANERLANLERILSSQLAADTAWQVAIYWVKEREEEARRVEVLGEELLSLAFALRYDDGWEKLRELQQAILAMPVDQELSEWNEFANVVEEFFIGLEDRTYGGF